MLNAEFVEQRRDLTDPLIIDYLQSIRTFYGLNKDEYDKSIYLTLLLTTFTQR